MTRSAFFILTSIAFMAGCVDATERARSGGAGLPSGFDRKLPEGRGQLLARGRCSDCHSVDHVETSPVPIAPSFAAIANTQGLTTATLAQWLRDHRNYPEEMYFEIGQEHVDDLVAYILTLRRPELSKPR